MSSEIRIKLYNQKGEVIGEKVLNSQIFGVEINKDLVHQALVTQMSNKRKNLAHTKQRSEVRGGGKKPWRQKGTGRARHGSIRSPLWIGGGITFGPTKDRNFSKKINKKMKRKALFMVLSDKVVHDALILVDNLDIKEIKTKEIVNFLKNFPQIQGSILLVYADNGSVLSKSARNIPGIKTLDANSLNIVDLLKYKNLIMLEKSIDVIEKTYFKK